MTIVNRVIQNDGAQHAECRQGVIDRSSSPVHLFGNIVLRTAVHTVQQFIVHLDQEIDGICIQLMQEANQDSITTLAFQPLQATG